MGTQATLALHWTPERVLDYSPRLRFVDGWRYDRRHVLWPMDAWQVIVPRPERNLDLLQRAVLRLSRSGLKAPDAVATTLSLDPDLVAILLEELKGRRYLTPDGRVTPQGEEALDNATPSPDGVMTGWVFRDTWTGELLPRFVTDWAMADLQIEADRPFLVTSGSRGRPRPPRSLFILPRGCQTTPPAAREVLDAARRHRRQERRLSQTGDEEGALAATGLELVGSVATAPVTCHLVTFLASYDAKAIGEGAPAWAVAEPFGFGASECMRETLHERMTQNDSTTRRFYESIAGPQLQQLEPHYQELRALVQERAEDRLRQALPGRAFHDVPRVHDRLRHALTELQVARDFGGARATPDTADGVWLALRQSLEAALDAARQTWLPPNTWRALFNGQDAIPDMTAHMVLRQAGDNVGFASKNLPRAVSKTRPHDLRRMCESNGSAANLRPLCAALLLAASQDPQHPLRAVAAASPGWLADLDTVATHAGARVHNQGHTMTLRTLEADAQRTLDILATLALHR